VALISVSLALSQTPVITLRDYGYGASASRGVPVYVPAFAGIHCAYPRRDGEAELTWVPGYMPGWSPIQVLTGPGWCWLTSLMQSTTLPTEPDHHQSIGIGLK